MRSLAVPFATALLVAAATASPLAAQRGEEREAPEVERLTLRGVHAVDQGDLQKSIATKSSRCRGLLFRVFCLFNKSNLFFEKHYLDRAEFRRDVLRIRVFYWKRGYRSASVDTTVERGGRGGVRVAFNITEGPPTRVSSVTVLRAPALLRGRTLSKLMKLHAGEPFNLLELDSSVVRIREYMGDKGYADAVVTIDSARTDTTRRTASVALSVDAKWLTHIGSIAIKHDEAEGDDVEHISERTIRNSLTIRPGMIYRRNDVIESQRNLYESNLFRHAVIMIPPEGDSIKNIVVTVREAPPREMRTSGGFNTVEFLQVEQRFTRYNFLGGGRRLDLRGVVGNILAPQLNGNFIFRDVAKAGGVSEDEARPFLRPTWQASADFTNPWFHGYRNTLGGSVFAHRRSWPGVFIDHGYGASAAYTRRLTQRTPATLSYRFEVTQVEAGDTYYCVNFGVCEVPVIAALRRSQRLSPLALSFFTDKTNDLFFPTQGSIVRADVEHASAFTLSDFRYNRAFGEVSRYWKVRHQGALATRVRAGWVKTLSSTDFAVGGVALGGGAELLHPRKRFYAGGSQSVRGYGENQLGPRVLTIDPGTLRGSDTSAVTTCRANDAGSRAACALILDSLTSDKFQPRPTGGTSLIEGSVELRFPIWTKLGGAVFVDGAFVGQGALGKIANATGAVTPGFGFRYYSPAGAIRVDLGWRPSVTEKIPVVTEVKDAQGRQRIVQLNAQKNYNPFDNNSSGFKNALNHLQLHLSIGQAF